MKRLLIAAAVVALTATASSAAPTKKDVFDLLMLNYDCGWFGWSTETEQDKACKALERAIKKLNAQGYCFIGHGVITRSSKDKKHCFYLKKKKDARIMQYIKQYWSEEAYIPVWKERCKKNPALRVCENHPEWKEKSEKPK
jgi:hypothetical protein